MSSNSETITFSLDVYDESGIEKATIWLRRSGGVNTVLQSTDENPTEISYTFDSTYPEGEYNITIDDLNGNSVNYNASDLDLYGLPDAITILTQQDVTWDFDKNGSMRALSDGLLFLRYIFGFRGDDLTNGVISTDLPLSPTEVESSLENALIYADIDGNGDIEALTDGLLLMRYAFNLRGNTLVKDLIGPNALRASAADIEAYIESHMP